MAEADNKSTASRFLTLPQAAERIGREELQVALEDGRLLATDRKNRPYFEELAWSLQDFALRGAPQADLDAVRAISRGFAIPPQSWRRWFYDGSVNFETDEIVRPFLDRAVIYRPVLLGADISERRATAQSIPDASVPAEAVAQDVPPEVRGVDPFNTGAGGRPSAMEFVLSEAKRRISGGEVEVRRGLQETFSETLANWWEEERKKYVPHGPKLTAKAIRNKPDFRSLWHQALAEKSQNPPSENPETI